MILSYDNHDVNVRRNANISDMNHIYCSTNSAIRRKVLNIRYLLSNQRVLRLFMIIFVCCVFAPQWDYAQDLTKFSSRTCNNGGDLSSATTSWQTVSGNIASDGFTRHDVYLTSDRQYIFSLCSDDGGAASIDTYMALFKGWGCDKYTSENLLAYNDDGCGTASKITYTANFTGWATLYITAYYSNTSGTYTLKYKYVDNSAPSGPTNSTCANATTLDCGTTLNGTTVGTSGAAHGLPSSASTSNYGVWYTFTGTGGDTKITVTPASGYDTKISVVSGSCGSFTWVGSADNGGSGYADTYTFSTASGTRYYVYVAHYSSSSTTTGAFTISRECPGPANSTCATATRLDCGATLNGTTIGTTGTAHGLPSSASVSNYGVWYTFVGNGAPTTISVHATGYDTEIDVVSGSCGSFTWVGYNDNGNSTTSNDTYSFTTVAGTTYYVYVAHYNSSNSTTGTFTISRSCDPPAPREMLCGTTYSGTLGLYGVWNSYTSCGYNEPGEEHIYEFTAPVDGSYTFSTTSSGDPDFFLMTDYDNTSTNLIGACWESGNKTVTLEEGETYYVVADNYSSSSTATYTLSVTCPTQTYTVTYNANGGTGTMTDSNSPYNAGSTVTTMTNTFTNIGYTFAGWNTVGNGSGTAYAEGATFTINEDITLYAQWTLESSTIGCIQDGFESGTTSYAPFQTLSTNWLYMWLETIYPHTPELVSGDITSISYECTTANAANLDLLNIYIGTTSRNTHSSSNDWQSLSNLTLVYSHTNVIVSNTVGWETFNFDIPWYYNGTDNIIVVIQKKQSIAYGTTNYRCSNYSTLEYSGRTESYSNYPGTNTGSMHNNWAPNIQFCYNNWVLPEAQVNDISNQTVCNGDNTTTVGFCTTNMIGTTTYSWTNNNTSIGLAASGTGDIASFRATNTGTAPVTATITVTPSIYIGGVNSVGTPKEFTITVNPTATVNDIADQTVCNGDGTTAVNFGTTNTGGTVTYSWTNSNTAIGLAASGTGNIASFTATNTGVAPITATITVTPHFNDGCEGTEKTFTITVNNPVVGTVIASADPATICNGASTELTASATGNSGTMSYLWSTDDIDATISVSPTVNTTYTVTATATVGGCTAATTKQVSVAITDEPEITSISTPAAVCDGETLSLSTPTVTNHGSAVSAQGWQISANGSTYSSFNSSTAVTYSQNGNYIRYYATNTCGTVYSNTIQIIVNDRPSVSPITAPDAICVGEQLDLTTPTVTPNGLSISAEGWEISSSQNGTYTPFTNSNLQQNQDGYYIRYTATNACGSSSNTGVQITVNAPSISITSTYDYVWRGGTSNWNIASNWYEYNNGTYTVASALPAEAKNYYIALGGTGTCLNDVQQAYMNADATVNTIEIAPGAEVHIQENVTLQLAGSIINNGTFVADNSSTIELNGAADQTLTSAMEFGNVTFAQTANNKKIIAPHGITVHGLATFTKGVVVGDMTFVSGATTDGANLASHVDGRVTKFGNGAFTFPTGSNGVLGTMEATIANNSRAGINLRFNNASADGHGYSTEAPDNYPRWWNINDMCSSDNENRFEHVSNFEFWQLDGISGGASLSGITLKVDADVATAHFHDGAIANGINANINAAAHYDCWKNIGGTANVENEGKTITVTGISSINYTRSGAFDGIVTLGSKTEAIVLPIELTSFTATCDGKSALVEWTTATERNNDYFVLERSDDAINFTEVARVAGAGNSIDPLDYSYTDYGIHGGDNYYRLVQVDYDGTRSVSDIVVVNCIETAAGEPDVQAYPNPFDGELTLELENFDNRPARIDVYDMLGKLIYTDKVASPQNYYETVLNLGNLPPATYTVRVSTADFVINKKVVKQ